MAILAQDDSRLGRCCCLNVIAGRKFRCVTRIAMLAFFLLSNNKVVSEQPPRNNNHYSTLAAWRLTFITITIVKSDMDETEEGHGHRAVK